MSTRVIDSLLCCGP